MAIPSIRAFAANHLVGDRADVVCKEDYDKVVARLEETQRILDIYKRELDFAVGDIPDETIDDPDCEVLARALWTVCKEVLEHAGKPDAYADPKYDDETSFTRMFALLGASRFAREMALKTITALHETTATTLTEGRRK